MYPYSSLDPEKAVSIAILLLKHRSEQKVERLQALLTYTAHPERAAEILTTAVIRLVHTCPRTALWLFQHPRILEPAIQTREIVAWELTRELLSRGYSPEDFSFTPERDLETSENFRRSLFADRTAGADTPVFALIRALLAPDAGENLDRADSVTIEVPEPPAG